MLDNDDEKLEGVPGNGSRRMTSSSSTPVYQMSIRDDFLVNDRTCPRLGTWLAEARSFEFSASSFECLDRQ